MFVATLEERRSALDVAHAAMGASLAAFVHELGRFGADHLHRFDGARTLGSWLQQAYGYDAAMAGRLARAAEVVLEEDAVGEALAAGAMTLDHASVLAKHPRPAENLQRALETSAKDLDDALSEPAEPDPTGQEQQAATTLRCVRNPRTGMVTITVKVPLADGETVMSALERKVRQVGPLPEACLVPLGQRLACMFVDLCSAEIAGDPDPDRATISVHTDVEVVRGWIDGLPIPSETLRRLACDGRYELIVHGPAGVEPWHSPVMTDPAPWQRRAVAKRDGRMCRFPGCGGTWLLHLHHLVHREHGGPNVLLNLVFLCPHHHRLVHEGGWSTTGDAEHLRFVRPDGLIFRSRAGPLVDIA